MKMLLEIPDNKISFFTELIQDLGFVKIEQQSAQSPLTKRQMELVDIEVQKAKDDPNYMLDWDEVKHKIDWDAC